MWLMTSIAVDSEFQYLNEPREIVSNQEVGLAVPFKQISAHFLEGEVRELGRKLRFGSLVLCLAALLTVFYKLFYLC